MGKSTAAKGGFLKKMRKTERKIPKNASRSMQNNNAVRTIAKSVCQNANAEPRKSSFSRHFRFVKIFYSFEEGNLPAACTNWEKIGKGMPAALHELGKNLSKILEVGSG